MSSLQDLINLSKADGGKFFVMDENGDAKLVIMSIEDYQKMLLGKLKKQVQDIEQINKLITRVQLEEDEKPQNFKSLPRTDQRSWSGTGAQLSDAEIPAPIAPQPKPIPVRQPRVDLREEVIDPSFNFEGPKVEIDDL